MNATCIKFNQVCFCFNFKIKCNVTRVVIKYHEKRYMVNKIFKGVPLLFFHDFQISKTVSPTGLEFLSQIDYLK